MTPSSTASANCTRAAPKVLPTSAGGTGSDTAYGPGSSRRRKEEGLKRANGAPAGRVQGSAGVRWQSGMAGKLTRAVTCLDAVGPVLQHGTPYAKHVRLNSRLAHETLNDGGVRDGQGLRAIPRVRKALRLHNSARVALPLPCRQCKHCKLLNMPGWPTSMLPRALAGEVRVKEPTGSAAEMTCERTGAPA